MRKNWIIGAILTVGVSGCAQTGGPAASGMHYGKGHGSVVVPFGADEREAVAAPASATPAASSLKPATEAAVPVAFTPASANPVAEAMAKDFVVASQTAAPAAIVTPKVVAPGRVEVPNRIEPVVPRPEIKKPRRTDERKFDVNAVDAPAQAFFMGLSQDTGVNVVVHPDIKSSVSVSLRQVTLEETLKVVSDMYELDYIVEDYGYRLMPRKLQSRIFKLDYLDVSREGKSSTQVSSGSQSTMVNNGANGGNNNSFNNASQTSSSGNGSMATQSSQIDTESSTDVWSQVKEALDALVSKEDGRSVVIDSQSGVIMVKAYPSELQSVETFIRKVQQSLTKQVWIEAKIVEVTLQDGSETGIKWSNIGKSGKNTLSISQKGDSPLSVTDNDLGSALAFEVASQDFTGVLNLLKAQGDVHVLSSPRIATVNNQKAVIKVGSDEYFVTNVSSTTTATATATNVAPNVSLQPFFSGIALDVTPQIADNNTVILHVHPTVTEVTQGKKTIVLGTNNTLELPVASSTVRETDSIIESKDGQVVVIGGLMQTKKQDYQSGVSFLADLPVLGNLFKQNRDTEKKSELVILLRPHVTEMPRHNWDAEPDLKRDGK